MKGLASVLGIVLLAGCTGFSGTLEMAIGGGPSAISLDEFNAAITTFNALIVHLNETFFVHPDVTGTVPTLNPMVSGFVARAAERYAVADWLAIGAEFEYAKSRTATSGAYHGAETSTIDIALDFQSIGILLGARATFLDVGLRLSADAAIGYYYGTLNHSIVFEIPSEYPDAISGVPPKADDHHSGGALGFDAGFTIDVPIGTGFSLGATVAYRSASIGTLRNAAGESLDLNGDALPEGANLDGISVRLMMSIQIDLSPNGGKEQQ